MKEVILNYDSRYYGDKPIIKLNNNFKILIDTGAERNIWVGKLWKFNALHAQKISDEIIQVAGIAGVDVDSKIYFMDLDINGFRYRNLHLLVPLKLNKVRPFDMILGISTFKGFAMTIDCEERKVYLRKKYEGECRDCLVESILNRNDNKSIYEVFGHRYSQKDSG